MRKKGQSTLEYALIIAVVVVALIAIMLYMRRGMLGRFKSNTDQIGNQFDPALGFQTGYEKSSDGTTTTTEERTVATGAMTSTLTDAETITEGAYSEFGGGGPAFHEF